MFRTRFVQAFIFLSFIILTAVSVLPTDDVTAQGNEWPQVNVGNPASAMSADGSTVITEYTSYRTVRSYYIRVMRYHAYLDGSGGEYIKRKDIRVADDYSVAISDDGKVIVVAEYDYWASLRLRVFTGTDYNTETVIPAPFSVPSDSPEYNPSDYGESLAINGDGSVIVVGADRTEAGGVETGVVYVYSGENYENLQVLTPPASAGLTGEQLFGSSVDVSVDGSTIIVGNPAAFEDRGQAYVYRYTNGTYMHTATLNPSDADAGTTNWYYGKVVSASYTGNKVAVRANTSGDDGFTKIYVYEGAGYPPRVPLINNAPSSDWFANADVMGAEGDTYLLTSSSSDEVYLYEAEVPGKRNLTEGFSFVNNPRGGLISANERVVAYRYKDGSLLFGEPQPFRPSLHLLDPEPDVLDYRYSAPPYRDLANRKKPVRAVAADGVTQVLLRASVPKPGTVEFCRKQGYGDISPVTAYDDALFATCVPATTQYINGEFLAFAMYRAPEGLRSDRDKYPIEIEATFTPSDGSQAEITVIQEMELRRPPVLFVHGLWGTPYGWEDMPIVDNNLPDELNELDDPCDIWELQEWKHPVFLTKLVDYQSKNARHFDDNRRVVQSAIDELHVEHRNCSNYRFLFTQVDYVGHSMGGILGRNHINGVYGVPYYTRRNYGQGNINRLITVNTPHGGSPIADVLVGLRDVKFTWFPGLSIFHNDVVASIEDFWGPIDEGAIDDLRTGSEALRMIGFTPVRSHAMVGDVVGTDTTPREAYNSMDWSIREVLEYLKWFGVYTVDDLIETDGIVSVHSQRGGIASGSQTNFKGLFAVHTNANKSREYSNVLEDLLRDRPTQSNFSYFPPTTSVMSEQQVQAQQAQLEKQVQALEEATPGLTISGITNGQNINPGDTLNITVSLEPEAAFVTSVLLATSSTIEIDDTAPFEFTVTIPEDFIGPYTIGAMGKDAAADNFAVSDELSLTVTTDAVLGALTAADNNMIFVEVGNSKQIRLMGTYSDSVERTIPGTMPVYTSSDETVVTVDASGLVTAVGEGTAEVTATVNGVPAVIEVLVDFPNIMPGADAGADQSAIAGSTVMLDGTASSDPDGPAQLTYEWGQVSGPEVVINNADTATPSVTLPTVGEYTFALSVYDGETYGPTDEITIMVSPDVDLNGDGFITPSDALFVINRLGEEDELADVDGDGTVTQADVDIVMDAIGSGSGS